MKTRHLNQPYGFLIQSCFFSLSFFLLFLSSLFLSGCETLQTGAAGRSFDRGIHAFKDVDALRGRGTIEILNMNYEDAFLGAMNALMGEGGSRHFAQMPDLEKGSIRTYLWLPPDPHAQEPYQQEGWTSVFLKKIGENQVQAEVIHLFWKYDYMSATEYPKHRIYEFEKSLLTKMKQYQSNASLKKPRFWDSQGQVPIDEGIAFDYAALLALQLGRPKIAAEQIVFSCNALYSSGFILPSVIADEKKFKSIPEELWLQVASEMEKLGITQPSTAHVSNNLVILSKILEASGKLDEAEELARSVVQKEELNYQGYGALGSVLWKKGHVQESIISYFKAWQILPGDLDETLYAGQFYSSLGRYLADQGGFDEGLEALKLALDRYQTTHPSAGTYRDFLTGAGLHHGVTSYRLYPKEHKGEILSVVKGSPAWIIGLRPGDYWFDLHEKGREGDRIDVPLLPHLKDKDVVNFKIEKEHKIHAFYVTLDWTLARKKAEEFNQKGLSALEKESLEEAANEFKAAVQMDSSFANPHLNLASVYENQGAYDKAYLEYLACLALDPDSEDISKLQETAQQVKAKVTAAPDEIFPRDAEDFVLEGNAWAKNENYAKALLSYANALEIFPGLAGGYLGLGTMFEALDMPQSALKAYTQYIAAGFEEEDQVNRIRQHIADLKVKSQV